MTARNTATLLAILLATTTALTACGRRAALETPAQVQARQQAEASGEPAPAEQPKPDKPFFLDPLIE